MVYCACTGEIDGTAILYIYYTCITHFKCRSLGWGGLVLSIYLHIYIYLKDLYYHKIFQLQEVLLTANCLHMKYT